jgi:serine/threonine-protein kinase RsbW
MTSVPILRTVAAPGAFDETETALERTWSMHGQVPPAIRTQMGIAVAEVVANIVEHGGAGLRLVQIEMQIAIQPDHVLVVLIDDGNEAHVDFDTVGMPEDLLAERGRGLAMATMVLNSFTYRREAGLNRWTMASHPFEFVEAVA